MTEQFGTIVATITAGRLVPLELRERHDWGTSTLDLLDKAAGGDPDPTLLREGVEVAYYEARSEAMDSDETVAVLEEISEAL
ncbi:hypothetical protein [Aquisalimonas sp.]|uniref:hypothetical protein n=1 Tax=Aquisalimonas sp. TaxID=1872621 RepID=UPI0025B892FA|nr:hypothetical protein [Aquisalimonas sp.]